MQTSSSEHETENEKNAQIRENMENSAERRNQSEATGEASAASPEAAVTETEAMAAMQQQSNQETEIAAMLATKPTTSTLNKLTTQAPGAAAETPSDGDTCFAMPATPKAKTTTNSATSSTASSLGGSLKKKKRSDKQFGKRHASTTSEKSPLLKLSNLGEMKTSHSMTSLPPNDEQKERRDVIKAKLNLERPYNSLKKCAKKAGGSSSGIGNENHHHVSCSSGGSVSGSHNNSHHGIGGGTGYNCNKLYRHSWGSAYSHSSSTSLHSSATLGMYGLAKDDLWAAIKTDYNYIMDTNLMDTCKEAHHEIEDDDNDNQAAESLDTSEEILKALQEAENNVGLCKDPKELSRWLRDVEKKLAKVPPFSELTMLSNSKLQRHHAEHSFLAKQLKDTSVLKKTFTLMNSSASEVAGCNQRHHHAEEKNDSEERITPSLNEKNNSIDNTLSESTDGENISNVSNKQLDDNMEQSLLSADESGGVPTKKSLAIFAGIFVASLLAMFCLCAIFPELQESEKQYLKIPRDIQDAKQLGKVLDQYKDMYYFEVMFGLITAYVFLQTFAIPGSLFLSILLGFLYKFPIALFLICTCSALGATLCYSLSNLVGRRLIRHFWPKKTNEWSKRVEEHRNNLFNYMLFLRMTPILPNWFINLASPVIGVPLHIFILGTFCGVAPPSVIAIHAGKTLHKMTSSSEAFSWTYMFILTVCATLALLPSFLKDKLKKKLV